jgi:hypothetical protein
MKLNCSPGMRIVDISTNEEAGVFDKDGKPRIKPGYIKVRLTARIKYGKAKRKEVKKNDGKGCI